MNTAWQKRPFARPLLIWIAGILLQGYLSFHLLIGILLVVALLTLILSRFSSTLPLLKNRRCWGILFLGLLFCLSFLWTEVAERRYQQAPSPPGRLTTIAQTTQQQLVASFDSLQLSSNEKGLLSTITFGYRQAMDPTLRRQFSLTGVAHILAVSGFHVGIVGMLLSLLTRLLPRARLSQLISYLLNMLLLWSFVYISGLAASAVRAALMLSFYLTGRVINRHADSYNTLAASAFCMLLYNPFYLYDIGFQLSYTAVWFILYLHPRLTRLIPVRNPLFATPWSWICLTLSAQIGTTFLCMYYFSQFSLVFLFTNLPLTLFASLLIPAALLYALLPASLPGLHLLQPLIEQFTRAMVRVVEQFSALPMASLQIAFDRRALLLSYSILFLLLFYWQKRRAGYLLVALSLLLTGILLRLIGV